MKIQIAVAALKPSQYRKYAKGWKQQRPELRQKIADAFGGKYRSKPLDFLVGTSHVKAPLEIAEYFKEQRIPFNYVLGLAYPKGRNQGVRIGKLLPKELLRVYEQDGQRSIEHKGEGENYTSEIKGGNRSKIRDLRKNANILHQVIISRHPVDMIDAVHGRGLRETSMREGGSNERHLVNDAQLSLIAFIVRPTGNSTSGKETKVENVIGRIWIRPYVNAEGNMIWMADRRTYPLSLNVVEAYEVIDIWLNQHLNKASGSEIYRKHPEVYTDGFSPVIRYKE